MWWRRFPFHLRMRLLKLWETRWTVLFLRTLLANFTVVFINSLVSNTLENINVYLEQWCFMWLKKQIELNICIWRERVSKKPWTGRIFLSLSITIHAIMILKDACSLFFYTLKLSLCMEPIFLQRITLNCFRYTGSGIDSDFPPFSVEFPFTLLI